MNPSDPEFVNDYMEIYGCDFIQYCWATNAYNGKSIGVDAIHRAAATIVAACRGWLVRSRWEWGIFVKPYRNDGLIQYDAELEARDEMQYISDCVAQGCYVGHHDFNHDGDPDNTIGMPFGVQDALQIRMIKWLLRYDKKHYLKLADKRLITAIHDYQTDRLCAVTQVLRAKGVPREVFATHCGGFDIAGIYGVGYLSKGVKSCGGG